MHTLCCVLLHTQAQVARVNAQRASCLIINIERYFSIIHPALYRNEFTKRRFVLTWVFFWFFVLVSIVSSIYFSFLTKLVSISLGIIVLTSLYTYIAIFVVGRKKMLKVRNNNDQESRRNFMACLRDLKVAKTYVLIVLYASCVTYQLLLSLGFIMIWSMIITHLAAQYMHLIGQLR